MSVFQNWCLKERGNSFQFFWGDLTENATFKGAVKLPLSLGSERVDDFMLVANHWLELISVIRGEISLKNWDVKLDEESLSWNTRTNRFEAFV